MNPRVFRCIRAIAAPWLRAGIRPSAAQSPNDERKPCTTAGMRCFQNSRRSRLSSRRLPRSLGNTSGLWSSASARAASRISNGPAAQANPAVALHHRVGWDCPHAASRVELGPHGPAELAARATVKIGELETPACRPRSAPTSAGSGSPPQSRGAATSAGAPRSTPAPGRISVTDGHTRGGPACCCRMRRTVSRRRGMLFDRGRHRALDGCGGVRLQPPQRPDPFQWRSALGSATAPCFRTSRGST